jgi:phosphatidylserine/phosphatidylglycerophosphate/cardiolipin synthase-like enzyme
LPKDIVKLELEDGVIPSFLVWRKNQQVTKRGKLRSRSEIGATNLDQWIRTTLLSMISRAKKKIFLASFLVIHPDIEKALMEASKRLKGHVYVLSPLDNSIYKDPLFREDLSDEEKSAAFEKQDERIRALSQSGVFIREHSNCHAKFCVVDCIRALIMSANVTKGGMDESPEIGLVVKDPEDVVALEKIFTTLWTKGANRQLIPKMELADIRSIPKREDREDVLDIDYNGNVIWTYHTNHRIIDQLIQLIDSSKEQIQLGTYLFQGLHFQDEAACLGRLMKSFQNALKRGVIFEFVIRIIPSKKGLDLKKAEIDTLLELFPHAQSDQIKIFGHPRNHAKYLISDNSKAMMCSANFDGAHGLINGIEVGFNIQQPELVKWLLDFHTGLGKESNLILSYEPLLSDLIRKGDVTALNIKHLTCEKQKMESSVNLRDATERILRSPFVRWVEDPSQEEQYYLTGFNADGGSITITPIDKKNGAWMVNGSSSGNPPSSDLGRRGKKPSPRIGFLAPENIDVIASWKYSVKEIMNIAKGKIKEELRTKESFPLKDLNAEMLGVSLSEIPFDDTTEGWRKKLTTYLVDQSLERKGKKWWIRRRIEDPEIMDLLKGHTVEGKLDIPKIMDTFNEKGWSVPGITTGAKKLRQFYEKQTGLKVRKDGTIESDEKGS